MALASSINDILPIFQIPPRVALTLGLRHFWMILSICGQLFTWKNSIELVVKKMKNDPKNSTSFMDHSLIMLQGTYMILLTKVMLNIY